VSDLFAAATDIYGSDTMAGAPRSAAEVGRLSASAHLLSSASFQLAASPALAVAHTLAFLCSSTVAGSRAEEQLTALAQLAAAAAEAGGAAAAIPALAAADQLFPHSQTHCHLALARLRIAHRRAMHRGELRLAMELAGQMTALASPTDSTDIAVR
jgi:anaphase-promoting complex subunit 5